MSEISDQLEEIKILVSSGVKANKSSAYSSLMRFQEESNNSSAFMNALVATTKSLIPFIVCSIRDADEEIAAKSLKCLGFMIYHPSLVGTLVANEANLILESLIELILNTQMKSVCNLGVWCISIQQLDSKFLAAHFQALLLAVVHALDNPFGSLSTTFEAVQAIIKLAEQLEDNMKDMSSIWAPPIYRRLLSSEKRERNMSERCLLKTTQIILPPTSLLSKAIAKDMKKNLLSRMRELLNDGMKLHTIRAWGWYIRILGSHSMKDKHLVNDMLKIPECTFSHSDSQVRIATQVAWEGLIDALIQSAVLPSEKNVIEGMIHSYREQASELNTRESQFNGFLKSLRLIVAPLTGIMLSKCDISTHLSCLNTWFYLLHKLETSINDIAVIKLVVEPILELVFKLGHGSKSTVLRDTCMNLFHDFILKNCRNVENESNNKLVPELSITASEGGCLSSSYYLWKQYSFKWLPWNINHLDFFLKMIAVIIHPASSASISHENKSYGYECGLKLFISVLKGVEMELQGSSSNYDDVMLCLTLLSRFLKKICEEVIAEGCDRYPREHLVLDFIKATTEELENKTLGSPLYKVALDLNYVASQSKQYSVHAQILNIQSIAFLDMVSPVVYLFVLYFCMAAQSIMVVPPPTGLIQGIQNFFKLVYTSFEPLDCMRATVSLLYKHIGMSSLKLWKLVAKGLTNGFSSPSGLPKLRIESDSSFLTTIVHLLCYPVACSSEQSCESPQLNLELEYVVEAWEELYGTVMTFQSKSPITNILPEKLCSMIEALLDLKVCNLECAIKSEQNCADFGVHLLPLLGNIVRCVLDHITTSGITLAGNTDECDGNYKPSNRFNYILRLAVRFMHLSWIKLKDCRVGDLVTSTVFSSLAHFIHGLHLNQDIFAVIEMISCPLIPWFGASTEMLNDTITNNLQNLWEKIISCLQRSCTPIKFDLNLLKHSTHLTKNLHHHIPSISGPTIAFSNSTYGKLLDSTNDPQNLLHLLEIHHLRIEEINSPPRHSVTSTSSSSSKRIQLTKSVVDSDIPQYSRHKRKRADLTEHQKEVRRAQQGRERDCGRHGPGIRTYTSLDFSQGIEDSQ